MFLLLAFSSSSTESMQTFSNELIPLGKKSEVIILLKTTSHLPPRVSLVTIIHNRSCVFMSSKFSKIPL